MKLRINEDYNDNQKISDLLFDIENSGNERKIDKAYSYIDKWLDNTEDVYNDDYYDFRNASWGTSEKSIIDYLTNILNESTYNRTKYHRKKCNLLSDEEYDYWFDIGLEAFNRGDKCIPAHNKELINYERKNPTEIGSIGGKKSNQMAIAWADGWDFGNLHNDGWKWESLKEAETPNIEVKHKGVLEVPEGKNVDDLPLSHFVKLANKKGLSKITKALNNLQVWNKNDDPKLSKWAGNMIDKLNKKLKKDESLNRRLVKEDSVDDLVPDKVYSLSVLNDWWYDVIKQAKKFGIKDNEIDSEDENTLLFTFPAWDGLGYDRYTRLRNWCINHIYNLPEYIEAYEELH